MRIFRQLRELPSDYGPVVATIGNFDGVHRGHTWVIAEVIDRAHTLGVGSIAVTFDPHPSRILRPELAQPLITPLSQKLDLLAATGIDATLVLPFTLELSQMTSRTFAEAVLCKSLHAVEVHEGENFRFGYQAGAGVDGVDGLRELGREFGFGVSIFAPQHLRGDAVSSSRIRSLIAHGDVSQARSLLGRPLAIRGTPAPGRGYGTRYAVPTINLAAYPELLPANGVYVTSLEIGPSGMQETFDAVTNVGFRPTFGADALTVESHLLDFHPIDLTEETPLQLTFLRHLRPEIHWPSVEALREQIGRDVQRARRYFSLCRVLAGRPRSAALPQALQVQ